MSHKPKRLSTLGVRGLLALAYIALAQTAHASTSTNNLPFETPAARFVSSITGPIAGGIALLAIVGAGAALLMNGELGDFSKRLFLAVIVVLGLSGSLICGLFLCLRFGRLCFFLRLRLRGLRLRLCLRLGLRRVTTRFNLRPRLLSVPISG